MLVQSMCRGKVLFLLGVWFFIFLATAAAEIVDRIVAVVNDEVISQSELDQMAKALQSKPGTTIPSGSGKDFQRQLLDALIMQKLAKSEAKRRGITISEKEINRAFEEFKKRNRIEDEEVLAKMLAKDGLTIKSLKQQLAEQMLQERLLSIIAGSKVVVTETDVRNFYEQEYPKTGGVQVHLKMLNIPFPPGATGAQREEVKKKAELIFQEHRQGASWDDLSKKHSILINDLGFVAERDLDPQLAQFLSGIKSGDTAPIQTQKGFLLVQVLGRREGRSGSFEEAAPQIRQLLQRRQMEKTFKQWIESQRDKSHIKIMM